MTSASCLENWKDSEIAQSSQKEAEVLAPAILHNLLASLAILTLFVAGSCRPVDSLDTVDSSQFRSTERLEVVTTETGFEMVRIPAGRFQMGSAAGEPDEAPVHDVRVDSFLIDRCEVTQRQFARIAGRNAQLARDPSHFKGDDRPVEMVSWVDAALFCNERSRAEGLQPCYDEETGQCDFEADGYRLPTEAEWEYACRAGGGGDYYFGADPGRLDRYAWSQANSGKTTHPVGLKEPNAWGLFDMLGNVAEWCNDIYGEDYYQKSPRENPRGPADGEKYVLRGGAWNGSDDACRSSYRVGEDPGFQDACFARDAIGLRCVRSTP